MAGSTIKLRVEGMTCLDCSRHTTQALDRVPGVRSAQVAYRAGMAEVELAQVVAPGTLITAVERAGYRASVAAAERWLSRQRSPCKSQIIRTKNHCARGKAWISTS